MNFYSRYFIHESLFSAFSFLFVISYYKYFKSKKIIWAVWTGIFAGLIFSTKETSIIVFAVFALSLLFTGSLKVLNLKSAFSIIISFLVVSVVFYSSFFTNHQGIIDSVLTFGNYFEKLRINSDHIYPWYYYFTLVLFNSVNGYLNSEIIIVFFALAGYLVLFLKLNKGNSEFFIPVAIFTLILVVVYCLIPYKTPWCLLEFFS